MSRVGVYPSVAAAALALLFALIRGLKRSRMMQYSSSARKAYTVVLTSTGGGAGCTQDYCLSVTYHSYIHVLDINHNHNH